MKTNIERKRVSVVILYLVAVVVMLALGFSTDKKVINHSSVASVELMSDAVDLNAK